MSAAPNPAGPQLVTTKARGTIVKVPDATPGLMMVNGNQKQFTLEGVWKAPVAPAPNQTVEVETDAAGNIYAIAVVDSAQLARAKFNQLSGKVSGKLGEFAQGQGKNGANVAKHYLSQLATRMGTVTLVSAVGLWIAWFFLPGYKLDMGFLGSKTYTIWEFLGLDLERVGQVEISHGFWAILGVLCLLVPFVAPFVKDARARFANALPLVYSVIAIYGQRSSIIKAFEGPGVNDAASALSMQIGGYVVLLAAAVIAARALKTSS